MSLAIREQLGKSKTRIEKLLNHLDSLTPRWNDNTIADLLCQYPHLLAEIQNLKGWFLKWDTFIAAINDETDRDAEQTLLESWKEDNDYDYLTLDLEYYISFAERIAIIRKKELIVTLPPIHHAIPLQLNADTKPYTRVQNLDTLAESKETKTDNPVVSCETKDATGYITTDDKEADGETYSETDGATTGAKTIQTTDAPNTKEDPDMLIDMDYFFQSIIAVKGTSDIMFINSRVGRMNYYKTRWKEKPGNTVSCQAIMDSSRARGEGRVAQPDSETTIPLDEWYQNQPNRLEK